jgi:hypothetical protein
MVWGTVDFSSFIWDPHFLSRMELKVVEKLFASSINCSRKPYNLYKHLSHVIDPAQITMKFTLYQDNNSF